jgi:serine protease AprX
MPTSGMWKVKVSNTLGAAGTSQTYSGVLELTSARYAPMTDVSSLDSSSISEIYQNFRSLVMAPIGQRFRPGFAVTRGDLAAALVQGARVAQYLPAQSSYTDVRDRATMLFAESAQASPNGALFPMIGTGGPFQPDAAVDRLTAVVALVRAAGLRQQAESGAYTLTYADAASIPASLRGYVALAVQNGLITTSGANFNPQGNFNRLDLAHAMARIATLATQ